MLGSVSRATLHINATVFAVLLLVAPISGSVQRGGITGANDAVFALAFYRVVYPLIVKTLVVLLPLWWGMRRASGVGQEKRV